MDRDSDEGTRWWGEFELGEGERGMWRVGPLNLAAERAQREWRIERSYAPDVSRSQCSVTLPSTEALEARDVTLRRFSFGRTTGLLRLTPRLADRAVVVTPETPFFVPGGEEIVLFCSTPLWLRLEVGERETVLEEFTMDRPPDTWFGPSTREGELCYATRTAARLRREDLTMRPHRATTELSIRNESSRTLPLDRVNLSVPYLSLYAAGGRFWSDRVVLRHTAEGASSELEVGGGPPEDLGAELVSPARVSSKQGVMVRAFEALFN